jgi:hypothetical protein
MSTILRFMAVGLLSTATMLATTITDNFESYAPGTFPSAKWKDVGTVHTPPGQTLPSALVVSTTDAFGNQTQALGLVDQVAPSRGIYANVPVSANYTLAADIRVDRYSDHPEATTADWPMQLTFAEAGISNFASTPQAGIYASSLARDWRLFVIDSGPGADISLAVPANIGTWYHVQLDFNALTDTFRSRISDVFTGTLLVDQTNTIAGMKPTDTRYNSIAFFGGEVSTHTTVADQAVVDNVNISGRGSQAPEPSTVTLAATALAFLALRLRKEAR